MNCTACDYLFSSLVAARIRPENDLLVSREAPAVL